MTTSLAQISSSSADRELKLEIRGKTFKVIPPVQINLTLGVEIFCIQLKTCIIHN